MMILEPGGLTLDSLLKVQPKDQKGGPKGGPGGGPPPR